MSLKYGEKFKAEFYEAYNVIPASYYGPYVFTPSFDAQTIEIAGQTAAQDITIEAIDLSDATAAQGDILAGKVAYISSGALTGSMANNGATGGTISAKADSVSIPAGYTSGGSVAIASAEQDKIVATNIVSGVTLLGVAGSVIDASTLPIAEGEDF